MRLERKLFDGPFDSEARHRIAEAKKKALALAEGTLRTEPMDDLVASVCSDFLVVPIVLGDQYVSPPEEVELDATRYRESLAIGPREPATVRGIRLTVHVPFEGTLVLLSLCSNRSASNLPRGYTNKARTEILFTIDIPEHKQEETQQLVQQNIEKNLKLIRDHAGRQAPLIEKLNRDLEGEVRAVLEARLKSFETVTSSLEALGLQIREGSPSLPIRLEQKISIEQAQQIGHRAFDPAEKDGRLDEKAYSNILSLIRHMCRTFEGAPTAFRKLGEEHLRDVVKAALNAVYSASGEAFRNFGKTDICIEAGDRKAFVAECKVWHGPKELEEAINQLLGYLTWRDEKTSLIVFNKDVVGFDALRKGIPSIIEGHRNYRKTLEDRTEEGEWRFVFGADHGTEVACHLMIYHLRERA
jgi:hypothetical protein